MSTVRKRRIVGRLDKVFSIYITGIWGTAFGIARNISQGGMFIETADPYPLGSLMEITFSYPGSDVEMSAEAEVVHLCFLNRTPAGGQRRVIVGMGVRFNSFSAQQPGAGSLLRPIMVQ